MHRRFPVDLERAVERAVVGELEHALAARGLLLSADRLEAQQVAALERGSRLLERAMRRCYPQGTTVRLEFESARTAARLQAALDFGAVTGSLFVPADLDGSVVAERELACAIFNLGAGLVDSIADANAAVGLALLDYLEGRGVAGAAATPQDRGWLSGAVPAALGNDVTVAFAIEVLEAFFEAVHIVFPGDARLSERSDLGDRLAAALGAERRSIGRSGTADELLDASRLTSVLPFEIIASLASGRASGRSAGTLLGEAMWRVDDLVDLGPDARTGALNGLLVAARDDDAHAALERLLGSTSIAKVAADAAEQLRAGLRAAPADAGRAEAFLSFVQSYAGLPPHPS